MDHLWNDADGGNRNRTATQLGLLAESLLFNLGYSVIAAACTALLLSLALPAQPLLIWLAALLAIVGPLYLLVQWILRPGERSPDPRWSIRVLLGGYVLLGIAWGGLVLVPGFSDDGSGGFFLGTLALLLALIGIALVGQGPPQAIMIFSIPALLPTMIIALRGPLPWSPTLGVLLALVVGVIALGSQRLQRLAVTALKLREDNSRHRERLRRLDKDLDRQSAVAFQHRFELAETQAKFFAVTDHLDAAVFILRDGQIVYANPALLSMSGYSSEALQQMSPWQLVYPVDHYRLRRFLVRFARHPDLSERIEFRAQGKDGHHRWVAFSASNLMFEGEAGILGIAQDVSSRQRVQATLDSERERMQMAMATISDGVMMTDANGVVNYLNPIAEEMCGWVNDEAQGQSSAEILRLVDARKRDVVEDLVAQCLNHQNFVRLAGHVLLSPRDGHEELAVEVTVAPIFDDLYRLIGTVTVLHDVTQLHGLARMMDHRDSHDSVTGLLNRATLEGRLGDAVEDARHQESHHVLCHLDLDNFRVVNEACGHEGGDQMLRQLGQLLLERVRRSDMVGRLGGDEFGLLLHNCRLVKAEQIAEQLRRAVQGFQFQWEHHTLSVTASIGMVPITSDSRSLGKVLSAADLACYMAKDLGRNRVHIFASDDSAIAHRHGEKQWLHRIRTALQGDRLILYVQEAEPLQEETTSRYGEILLRMLGDDDQVITPGAFLPVAEHFQLMSEIDRWVVHNALTAMKGQHAPLESLGVCAINLSGQSLYDESFVDYIMEEIDGIGIEPRRVCFEITEATVLANMGRSLRFMTTLKEKGCRLALDDFGSGFSSFSYLKNLPLDYLKIDGVFLRNIASDSIDKAMVETINGMSHALGLKTIAKFTRDRSSVEVLRRLGVDYAQSFEVGRPEPITRSSRVVN